jgi:hypothetical protein
MAQLQIANLPRWGTQEWWRRLCQEVAELRPEQSAGKRGSARCRSDSCNCSTANSSWSPRRCGSRSRPVRRWRVPRLRLLDFLREQLQGWLGWDVQEVLADPPADLLLTWEGEGDDEWTETGKTARHRSQPPAMAMEDDTSTKGGQFND